MIRAGILGASGYTGARLVQYLSRHREANIAFITSRKEQGRTISDLYGSLKGVCDTVFSDPDDIQDAEIDVLFTCAPDQVSMRVIPSFYDRSVAIVDLAGDYRMDTAEAYERWYGAPHVSPGYIEKVVYGLTEVNRGMISATRFVSNPGCYPTSVLLAITPLLRAGLISPCEIYVNAVGGISGAGRGLSEYKMFYETDSNVLPYKLGRVHKHVGEMEQELSKSAGVPCTVIFSPHVVPMKTGIVSTILVTLEEKTTPDMIDAAFTGAYGSEFFVRYRAESLPESKFVADTNFCDIGFSCVEGTRRAVIVSTICNLGKGASGQAVQNMNVMFGFDEKEGLV